MTSQNTNESSETHAEATSSTNADNILPTTNHDMSLCRQPLIQNIPQRKHQVYNWPHHKKLCKLAIYSACQIPECSCTGWKDVTPDNMRHANVPNSNFPDPCHACNHQLEEHVAQLQGEPVEEINRLLGIVVDVENLHLSMKIDTNSFRRQSYYFIFKALYRCVQTRSTVRVPGPLGPSPFQRPTVAKAIANFMLYKYNEVEESEWRISLEVAEIFLNCLNDLTLQTPNEKQRELLANNSSERVDVTAQYMINYIRWFVACFVPRYCDSLPRYSAPLVFGRTLLRDVYRDVAAMVVRRCRAHRVPPYKRELYYRLVPQFLALFELETFSNDSPVWTNQFHQLIDYENDMIGELHRLIPQR